MSITAKLTNIADAIRGKTGKTDALTLEQMATEIEGISAGGGDSLLKGIIERTVTEISDDTITSIGVNAFNGCAALTTADFPAVTSVSTQAFQDCAKLTTANFPVVTSIGNSAFNGCTNLITAIFPVATSIGNYAFYRCNELIEVVFPAATSSGDNAFQYCTALTTAIFPVATSISSGAFRYCEKLTNVNFPAVTSIGNNAFQNCRALTTVILRNTSKVAALSSASAFASTPTASGTGYIYVPAALIEDYKVATNWSTYAAQFRALEDYTVDGTTTGELDPNKTGVTA